MLVITFREGFTNSRCLTNITVTFASRASAGEIIVQQLVYAFSEEPQREFHYESSMLLKTLLPTSVRQTIYIVFTSYR
jgi:hypothetical protein